MSTFYRAVLLAAVASLFTAAAPQQTLNADGVRLYEDAVRLVQAGRYRDAFVPLNTLARDYPRVPEVFATRCSAQLGAGSSAAAEADCRYALALKPDLATAIYALAVAQDNQGNGTGAVATYRSYAARPDADPSLRANALARVEALSSPRPLAVAPPPPPGAPAAADNQRSPLAGPRGSLFIYRNHFVDRGNREVTLVVDDQIIGDIGHDQYVEVQLPAGEHQVEACIGGVRYRNRGGWPTLHVESGNGRFDARVGTTGETSDRIRCRLTLPVEVAANGATYVNFDTVGGVVRLVNQPPSTGREELTRDCTRAYTKKL
jgi:hypothetical protein